MDDELLTPGEVARRLKVTEQTVCNWLRTGELTGVKAGRLWRVPSRALAGFLKADQAVGNKGGEIGSTELRLYSRDEIQRFIAEDQIDADTAARVRQILRG